MVSTHALMISIHALVVSTHALIVSIHVLQKELGGGQYSQEISVVTDGK